MAQSERAVADEKARKALADTLRKVRLDIVAHCEGDYSPRIVRDTVEDLLDFIDWAVEDLGQ